MYIDGVNSIALIKDDLLLKMNTKRLLNIKRKLGGLKNKCAQECWCGCGQVEILPNYTLYREREAFVKSILDTREHIEK